jgi:hypothetical protein
MAAKVPSADTDEMGHFQIKHLWFGRLAVAKKRAATFGRTGSGWYWPQFLAFVQQPLSFHEAYTGAVFWIAECESNLECPATLTLYISQRQSETAG